VGQTVAVETWAIVVAAGGGSRFGAAKQFARLGNISVLDRAVGVSREACDGVVVVLPPGREWSAPDGVRTAVGGATRSASVRAGLACIPDAADVVVVHDAARPLASRQLFARVIAAVRAGADAAVPGVPVADTE
jgi:2-C-methyl-D-erythritol 4-phosphate cytidylyltransferase